MSANRFLGVNPHLNSLLQTPGTDEQPSLWASFHSSHINHIADFLNQQLAPNYTAYSEQSLQVRGVDWGDEVVLRRPRPDVTIFSRGASSTASSAPAATPTWHAAIADVMEPVRRPVAVVIRSVEAGGALGHIVCRIELLSPSNKPGGADFRAYEDKRLESLESGIPLVEIDYLHEMPPVIPGHPIYPDEVGSYPFLIAVSDPRPTWEAGQVEAYGVAVDHPLPSVPIPLLPGDALLFDFDAVYQYTFHARRFFNLIDEHNEPLRLSSYSPADRAAIRARLAG